MKSQYLSVKEFAFVIGKSRAWVYSKIGTGEIPQPVCIGKTKRWDAKGVEKWLAGLSKIGKRNRKKRSAGLEKLVMKVE